MTPTTDQTVDIPLSKRKVFGLLLISSVMTSISMLMFMPSARHIPSVDGIRYVIAAVSLAFFGFATVKAIQKLIDVAPGLRVSAHGLVGDTIRPSGCVLTWSSVVGIAETRVRGQRFVSVLLRDPRAYISRGFGGLAASAMQASLKLTGSPVNISANTLKISHADLLKLLKSYFERYGQMQ